MKNVIFCVVAVLGLNGCAMTGPTVEEVVATYHTELNAPHKETIRQKIVDSCSLVRYKDNDLEGGCYLSSDVIVYEFNITNNRIEWSPQAASTITKLALREVCEDENEALKYGFGLLVNLEGKNGFVGKLKNYKDCENI
ncbi:hypothetical protein [Agarivorans sp. Toyoura001]|uniref:hypothetical protein n=1 Tax=unclassified Agarivorans TaxID=2636026 RepID=UPI0010D9FBD0|nr:hypothetical protein [Agarivorans sp. Toyoura001]GDY24852.1 hypothetical protein AHAT_07420 [Agarivorans sp. Toyoura001]